MLALARIDAGGPPDAVAKGLLEKPMPDGLEASILDTNVMLQASRSVPMVYAVRSSATAEDLGSAGFAGQHKTFYYVTRDELIENIRLCRASPCSPASL